MEVPGKKMEAPDGESTESVVLQCTSSGDVEDGEEVVRSEPVSETLFFSTARGPKTYSTKKMMLEFDESDCEEEEKEGVVRSSGLRAWLTNIANDTAYWNSGGHVRPRRCKAPKACVDDVGEAFVIDRTPVKRKYEEVMECSPVSESELDEGGSTSESDDDDDESAAASSSDSDASESEYENTRSTTKRRRALVDESRSHLTFPSRKGRHRSISSSSQDASNCDNEMKEMQEMQVLLELQLKASERRETEMKQRMETMMDLMSSHIGHVEKRVSTLEVGSQPQEQMLERINVKLEKVMEGFTTLNENLSILSACLSKDLDSQ